VNFKFVINAWSATAAGLHSHAQWQAWAAQPYLPEGPHAPELGQVPAMTRRRLSALGRLAVHAAWECQGERIGLPVVFASRYGDAERSLEMLARMAGDEGVSPTSFGLAVHNAIGAMYSIVRGDTANYLSLAAGAASAAAALTEAAGLLADGAPEVMVVCYEAPLPGAYAPFADEPEAAYAWAWRVAQPAPGDACISLGLQSAGSDEGVCPALPFGLDVLRFALGHQPTLRRSAGGQAWCWQRHG
jgi:hypothetical protein